MISLEQYKSDNEMIAKAIEFAMKKHGSVENADGSIGQKRKGSGLPYIVHPLEVKSKTWKERKQHTIDALAHDSIETMQVCAADKLSNIRAQLYDYKQIGDALFDRFNKESDPGLQAWYYRGVVAALKPLSGMPMYEELKSTVEEVYKGL